MYNKTPKQAFRRLKIAKLINTIHKTMNWLYKEAEHNPEYDTDKTDSDEVNNFSIG
jgi:hypothetical protein